MIFQNILVKATPLDHGIFSKGRLLNFGTTENSLLGVGMGCHDKQQIWCLLSRSPPAESHCSEVNSSEGKTSICIYVMVCQNISVTFVIIS